MRRTGEPVAAVFGYANSLLTVLNELEPTHIIAAWDAAAITFRKERDERYKATRAPTPEDLVPQFDRVRELLDAFRIPLVELRATRPTTSSGRWPTRPRRRASRSSS